MKNVQKVSTDIVWYNDADNLLGSLDEFDDKSRVLLRVLKCLEINEKGLKNKYTTYVLAVKLLDFAQNKLIPGLKQEVLLLINEKSL